MLGCVLIFDHEICEGWLYQQHKVNVAGHAFCWKKPDKHNVMTGIYLVRLICLLWFSWVTVREVFPNRNKTMKHNFNETQTENVMNSDSHKVLCSSIVECVLIWINQFRDWYWDFSLLYTSMCSSKPHKNHSVKSNISSSVTFTGALKYDTNLKCQHLGNSELFRCPHIFCGAYDNLLFSSKLFWNITIHIYTEGKGTDLFFYSRESS